MARPAEDMAAVAPEATESELEGPDSIHRVDTVPPPEGEDDAYNAATRIGPMARGYVEQLMASAEEVKVSPPSGQFSPISEVRSVVPFPKPARLPSTPPPDLEIARLHGGDEGDDDDGELIDPTALLDVPVPSPSTRAPYPSFHHVSSVPRPASFAPGSAALLPSAAPALLPAARPRSLRLELLIFAISFVAIAIPALYFVLRAL